MATVLERTRRGGVAVLDATNVQDLGVHMSATDTVVRDLDQTPVHISNDSPTPAWLRRLAPARWGHGIRIGSHRAAITSARMGLLGALLRHSGLDWLTSVEALATGENKIVQYRTATTLGIRVPKTLVTGELAELVSVLGEPFVLKPLGLGSFQDDHGNSRSVYAEECTAARLQDADLTEAPFLAQEMIRAERHLRVVTVKERAWAAQLDAAGLPCDWRKAASTDARFRPTAHPEAEKMAVHLAAALDTGYSSQDWIVQDGEIYFVDLNPAGQWLFLPPDQAASISEAVANWLLGGRSGS